MNKAHCREILVLVARLHQAGNRGRVERPRRKTPGAPEGGDSVERR